MATRNKTVRVLGWLLLLGLVAVSTVRAATYGKSSTVGGGGGTVKSAVAPLQIVEGGVIQIADGGIPINDPGLSATTSGTVTSFTISGLNGNLDGDYLISYHLVSAQTSVQTFTLQPNGVSSNQVGMYFIAGTGNTDVGTLSLGQITGGSETSFDGQCTFTSVTGRVRLLDCSGHTMNGTSSERLILSSSTWMDTTTNITSLVFVGSLASGIAIGSYAKIQRLGATN